MILTVNLRVLPDSNLNCQKPEPYPLLHRFTPLCVVEGEDMLGQRDKTNSKTMTLQYSLCTNVLYPGSSYSLVLLLVEYFYRVFENFKKI